MRFIQDAIPGSDEKGYSQALLGVDQFEHRIVVAILLVKLILGLVAVALFLL